MYRFFPAIHHINALNCIRLSFFSGQLDHFIETIVCSISLLHQNSIDISHNGDFEDCSAAFRSYARTTALSPLVAFIDEIQLVTN